MLKSIEEVYYIVDEIVQHGIKPLKKGRTSKLNMSEALKVARDICKQKNNCFSLLMGR